MAVLTGAVSTWTRTLEGASRVLDDLDKPVDPLALRSGELDELLRYQSS
jgi:hypothetical protein